MRLTQSIIAHFEPKEKRYDVKDDSVRGLFVRVEVSGRKSWFLRYAHCLTVKLGDARFLSPALARDKAIRFLSDFSLSGDDPRHRKAVCRTLGELLEQSQQAGKSAYLKSELYCFEPDLPLVSVTPLFVEKWLSRFVQSHRVATGNRVLAALKALLRWGERHRLCVCQINDVRKLPETDSKVITRYLSDEEIERLMCALHGFPQLFQAVVVTALNTGIRKGALLSLRWSDLNFAERSILLRAESAKNKRSVLLPMNESVASVLDALPRNGEFVFQSDRTGTRLVDVKKSWSKLLKLAAISDFRFHDLRHTFASRLVMKGVDLNTVRELLTHSDIKMTLRYAHLAPNVKKAAVDLLD